MFCQNTACLLVTVNLIIQNGNTLCCSHHCHFFWVVFVSSVVRIEADRGWEGGTTETENYPCNLNEYNIIKIAQWRSGYIAWNIILHSGPFVSLQTTGLLVKQCSRDCKAAWVCEMVGKNKRDARQEKWICRGIRTLHGCWLVPHPTVHSSGAVGKTLQSSATKNLTEMAVQCVQLKKTVSIHFLSAVLSRLCVCAYAPADLLNLWQGGRACGLTAGKSVPPTALALPPPTLSPSRCPTRSAYWRLIKEAALDCEQLGSCDLTQRAACRGFFLCEQNSKTHKNSTRMGGDKFSTRRGLG